jgi:uncharacterized membrane protein
MSSLPTTTSKPAAAEHGRLLFILSRYWWLILTLVLGVWIILPWLAPVFMWLGWTKAGNAIYILYAAQCHQLPQRSFFLFGQKTMYSLAEIQAAWQVTDNPFILRQFVGNAEMGWKVAWSDRMVSLYGGAFLFSLFYGGFRRLRPLPLWALALFLLPMLVDGSSHMVSDLQGIGAGFRDSNAWLATLTGHRFAADFYAGAALGSFNSWMRLFSGALAGLGAVWFIYPRVDPG